MNKFVGKFFTLDFIRLPNYDKIRKEDLLVKDLLKTRMFFF